MFMEMSYFNKTNAMASLWTEDGCLVWEISMEDFDEMLNKYPNITQDIEEIIDQRNRLNKAKMREHWQEDYAIDLEGGEDYELKVNL